MYHSMLAINTNIHHFGPMPNRLCFVFFLQFWKLVYYRGLRHGARIHSNAKCDSGLEGHGRSVFWRTSHPRFVRLWINFFWEQRLLECNVRAVFQYLWKEESVKCMMHSYILPQSTIPWGLYNYDTDIDITTIQCKGEGSVAHPEENKDCHLLGGLRL